MESAVFTRTRENDFEGDIAEFPIATAATVDKELRRWFSSHGTIAICRTRIKGKNALELWFRTHDLERRDLVGQRPILCIACMWSLDGPDFDRLGDLFAKAITQPEVFEQLAKCIHYDASRAEEVGRSEVPAELLRKCALDHIANSHWDYNSNGTLGLICEDNLENRVAMASLSRRLGSFDRLLIGSQRPPQSSLTRKTYALLPRCEVDRFDESMRSREGRKSLLDRMRESAGRVKDRLIGILVLATVGLSVHAFQLHQRLVVFEGRLDKIAHDEELLRRDLNSDIARAATENASLDQQIKVVKASLENLERQDGELSALSLRIHEQQVQLSNEVSGILAEQAGRLELQREAVCSLRRELDELVVLIRLSPALNR